MDVILLRKLARKSRFEAGRHPDLTVQDMLNLGMCYYLAALYYKYANISYLDDILEELYIVDDLVIEKPGSNYLLFNKWRAIYCEKTSIIDRQKAYAHMKSQDVRRQKSKESSKYMSKSHLKNKHRKLST